MNARGMISVVLITYNHERYIGAAIESILNQTYPRLELVVVDDGSSDKTREIARSYKDPRAIVIETDNSGPSIALNKGVERSKGDYIAFMSGDDVALPNRLHSQFDQLNTHNLDLVFSLPSIIGPRSEPLHNDVCPWFFERFFSDTAELYRQLFWYGNFLCAPSAMIRRNALDKVGRFKRGLVQLQDYDFWVRACKHGLAIKLFRNPLVKYRHRRGLNLSDKKNNNRVRVENRGIYRDYFDNVPEDLFSRAFNKKTHPLQGTYAIQDFEIDKTLLLLSHSDPDVRIIGHERLVNQLEDDGIFERLVQKRTFDLDSFFKSANEIHLEGNHERGALRSIRAFFRRRLTRS